MYASALSVYTLLAHARLYPAQDVGFPLVVLMLSPSHRQHASAAAERHLVLPTDRQSSRRCGIVLYPRVYLSETENSGRIRRYATDLRLGNGGGEAARNTDDSSLVGAGYRLRGYPRRATSQGGIGSNVH
jgi:hypothetical protein